MLRMPRVTKEELLHGRSMEIVEMEKGGTTTKGGLSGKNMHPSNMVRLCTLYSWCYLLCATYFGCVVMNH